MNEINSNLLGLADLPLELQTKIVSSVDLETLSKVASTCKTLYQAAEEQAKVILEDTLFKKMDTKVSAYKQLTDHYRLFCKTLNALFKKNLTNDLFANINILHEESAISPGVVLNAKLALEVQMRRDETSMNYPKKAPSIKDSQLQILIKEGARSDLDDPLQLGCSATTIQLIMNQPNFMERITLKHLKEAVQNKYPESILKKLVERFKYRDYDYSFQWEVDQCLYEILKKLPGDLIPKFMGKLSTLDANFLLKNLQSSTLNFSETALVLLLDHIDYAQLNEEQAYNLRDALWNQVFNHFNYSTAPLIKLLDRYSSTESKNLSFTFNWDYKFYKLGELFFKNDFILSLLKTQIAVPHELLEAAVKFKLSPEVVLKIYQKVDKTELKKNPCAGTDALTYLYESGSYDIAFELKSMKEQPSWSDVEKAIQEKKGESFIHLMLDAYYGVPEEASDSISYICNKRFLELALTADLSDSIIERIIDQLSNISEEILETAIEKQRSPELIEKLRAKSH